MRNLDTGKDHLFPCGSWFELTDQSGPTVWKDLYPTNRKVVSKNAETTSAQKRSK